MEARGKHLRDVGPSTLCGEVGRGRTFGRDKDRPFGRQSRKVSWL